MFGKLISWFQKDQPVEVKKEIRITLAGPGIFRAETYENDVCADRVAYGNKAEVIRRIQNFVMNSTPGYEIATCPEWDV